MRTLLNIDSKWSKVPPPHAGNNCQIVVSQKVELNSFRDHFLCFLVQIITEDRLRFNSMYHL